jgi:DNA-directed RNA polymerase specialized sigma24 family protein
MASGITQDVLIAVARKLAWLSNPSLFGAWAFRIADPRSLKASADGQAPRPARQRYRPSRRPSALNRVSPSAYGSASGEAPMQPG